MFLNAKGTIGKVDKDIDSFLAYVDGKAAEGKFTQDVASEVDKVKQHNETKVEYMTLMMELKQQRREGAEQKQVEISSLCAICIGCFFTQNRKQKRIKYDIVKVISGKQKSNFTDR